MRRAGLDTGATRLEGPVIIVSKNMFTSTLTVFQKISSFKKFLFSVVE